MSTAFDINHYRQGYSIGVGGVVLHEGEILLVRSASRRYAPTWSIPGGFVERDETMDLAIVREVKEETDVDAHVQGLIAARNRISDNENSAYFIFLLHADGGEPKADNVEVGDARYFTRAEMNQLDNLNPLTKLIVTMVFENRHKLMTFTPHPEYPPSEYILYC